MESAHLHQYHQQFQDHQLPPPILASSSSSSSLPNNNNTSSSPSSSYGVSTSCTTTWTPNTTLLSSGLYPNNNNILSSRNHHPHLNICNDSPMTQDLTFHHWANAAAAFDGGGGGAGQSIKQELSTIAAIDHHRHQQQQQQHHHQQRGLGEMDTIDAKLLIGTLSGAGHQPAAAVAHHQFYSDNNNNSNRGGRFSQIYPTISVPSLNQEASSLANSSSLGMNMQALDLFNSARLNASFGHTTSPDEHHQLGFHNYGFDHHHLHQPSQRSFGNVSSSSALLSNAICAEPKRPSNLVEPNPPQAPPKKSRLDSRASCPPFKVRKEKLGDRIAALQQLVAPFGKTDTASVLMEAIGYIKFLQNQVETLSVPYMKSSRNRSSSRAMHGGQEGNNNIGSEEVRRDLRSRGLCLVPLSCLSYVTDSGGGVWPPPNFGGS